MAIESVGHQDGPERSDYGKQDVVVEDQQPTVPDVKTPPNKPGFRELPKDLQERIIELTAPQQVYLIVGAQTSEFPLKSLVMRSTSRLKAQKSRPAPLMQSFSCSFGKLQYL